MKNLLLYVVAALLMVNCQQNETSSVEENTMEPEAPSIVGAWEIVDFTLSSPDSTWKEDAPYRSVIIFTKKYYSTEIARVERPSWADLPNGEERSAEDISNAYNGLTSNSGTYEIQGDSLVRTALIAKHPNYMNDEPTNSVGFKLDGDKMTTTNHARNNAEVLVTTTYRRLE